MLRSLHKITFVFLLSLCSHVYAEYVWLKPVGCATIVEVVKSNQEPQFYFGSKEISLSQLERDSTPKPPVATGGGDILTMLASAIPGIGSLAAATVGTVSESVINATINATRERALLKSQ